VGIGTTAERLHLLYGDRHALEAGTDSRGGYRVTVRLPFHEGRATSDPSTALTAHAYADR